MPFLLLEGPPSAVLASQPGKAVGPVWPAPWIIHLYQQLEDQGQGCEDRVIFGITNPAWVLSSLQLVVRVSLVLCAPPCRGGRRPSLNQEKQRGLSRQVPGAVGGRGETLQRQVCTPCNLSIRPRPMWDCRTPAQGSPPPNDFRLVVPEHGANTLPGE